MQITTNMCKCEQNKTEIVQMSGVCMCGTLSRSSSGCPGKLRSFSVFAFRERKSCSPLLSLVPSTGSNSFRYVSPVYGAVLYTYCIFEQMQWCPSHNHDCFQCKTVCRPIKCILVLYLLHKDFVFWWYYVLQNIIYLNTFSLHRHK